MIIFYMYLIFGCLFVLYCSTAPSYIHDRNKLSFVEMLIHIIYGVLLWFLILITALYIVFKKRSRMAHNKENS